ncbi:hypothetical protein GII33_10535 [Gordonia pseudamarae]|uniref:Uncharacterized protein n=1 Tax=Gordonia pseudamarae TaxID=2831662 RepID=A0ABX6IH94_9ACTN|nr:MULTISPECIES: hypothetical protein [Gordonia]MBD0022479.1 hypothetical protein [Gordonia sp. (in: high G+C Gram-positive bacteria)]QHN26335.1 hypothetical protein GII33_10535 [Gordonia pseudamarae]QHN35227.1 hypothetical protein GII31_10335 [Gordonia pseudamarae]
MAVCDPDTPAYVITRYLGFICEDANPVAALRNPFGLENWTLPILELTIIVGAILALVHAIGRLRRDGDPTNLALWLGSLVYLFVIEPPLYFPEWFGMQDAMGFMFAHNVFTVDFMYDRLPLYIVCFYPALSQVAYEIVRSFGFFDGSRYSELRGAVCVALVYQVFYEIFDQLGPQLKWWAWNVDEPFYGNGSGAADLGNPAAAPLLASVPLNSVWLFASVSFGVLTYMCARLVARPTLAGAAPRGLSLAWRIVASGVVAVISMPLMGIPASVFGRGDDANLTGQAIVLGIEILALWLIGLYLLATQWRRVRASGSAARPARSARPFLLVFPLMFLGVHIGLWIAALPAYFGAADGITDDGTPVGSLPYVIACLVVAVGSLAAALSLGRAPDAGHTVDTGDSGTRRPLRPV